jgi:lysophospholipase L1-like esterase
LLVLAIRPSPRRIKIIETERAMNRLFREAADADDRVTYLPGSCDRFLDPSGRPIPNLYADDQLHMNDRGYRIWKEILTPHLVAAGNSR